MRSVLSFEEALPRTEPITSEAHPLADRLHACSRLLAVAADELAALERGELTRRRELAETREELMREIVPPASEEAEGTEEAPPVVDELPLPVPQQIAQLLAEVLHRLEAREEEERRMQDRWSSLEGDALKAMHVGGRIASLRAGRYPKETPTDARLDLRF